MNYPVRIWANWYIAQGFGDKTSYGYHEAWDVNLLTGGNTDLGQDLLAVADGKISYYHNSHSTTGFGRHMVLECKTSKGTRWYHYAHCLEITTTVKEVKQGDVIGKLGSTGNSVYAHLHFSVFKVDPSTLPKGIDSFAKTTTELNASWEKFELLSKGENMPELIQIEKKDFEKLIDEANIRDAKIVELQDTIVRLEIDKKSLEEDIRELNFDNEKLAESLKVCQEKSSGQSVDIKSEVNIAGKLWLINGVIVDSDGKITANYKAK